MRTSHPFPHSSCAPLARQARRLDTAQRQPAARLTRRTWLQGALGLGLSPLLAGTARAAEPHWLAAWIAAERDYGTLMTAPGMPPRPPVVLNDQTVRLHVQPAVGGRHWRVRLSNRWGTQPLVLDGASLGLGTGAATLSPRSIVPLRFGGRAELTLAPGATVWSDALELPAQAQQSLALSFHVAQPFSLAAGYPVLPLGGSTWLMPGNQVSAAQARDVLPLGWGPAFTGLDVAGPPDARVLVAFGDSITEGVGAGDTHQGSYPSRLANRLRDQRPMVSVVNAGIAGNRLLRGGSGDSGLDRFERDVLAQSGVTHVLIHLGINDIGYGTLLGDQPMPFVPPEDIAQPGQIIEGLQQLHRKARERGIQVLIGTLLPFAGAPNWNEDNERKREAVNRWIRSREHGAAVVDFDAALRDPANPLRLKPKFDSGDHLHPGSAGLGAMADAVRLDKLQM